MRIKCRRTLEHSCLTDDEVTLVGGCVYRCGSDASCVTATPASSTTTAYTNCGGLVLFGGYPIPERLQD